MPRAPKPKPEMPKLLTPDEVAELRRCTTKVLARERTARTGIPFVKDGRRPLYFESDVAEYLATMTKIETYR